MPLLTLTEAGLSIDALSKNPVTFPSEAYCTSNSILASVHGNKLNFFDLKSRRTLGTASIDGYSEMNISQDGLKLFILTVNNKLSIFTDYKLHREFCDVENVSISNNFVSFSTCTNFSIYSHTSPHPLFHRKLKATSLRSFNSFILFTVKEGSQHTVNMFKDGEVHVLFTRPNIHHMVTAVSPDELSCSIVVGVEYSKNSYYPDTVLYLLWMGEKVNEEGRKKIAKCVSDQTTFQLFCYPKLEKIHETRFLDNSGFYVCFGKQPAQLYLFNSDGQSFCRIKEAVRNSVSFSNDKKRIINAGLRNLQGNIEVFDNEETTCKFEQLGASMVSWMPDGTHFAVATTSYFKTDNGVKIYDYYGRLINELKCETLIQASIYGDPEEPLMLPEPGKKNIQEKAPKYIPPHMQQREKELKKTPEAVVKQDTKEELEKKIREAGELKRRLAEGEDLTAEEQTVVFSLNSLKEKYNKLQ